MAIQRLRTDIVSPVGARQWLVKDEDSGEHFIVSGVSGGVLVFPANEKGQVIDWFDVAGGRGYSHDEAIDDLQSYIQARKDVRSDG